MNHPSRQLQFSRPNVLRVLGVLVMIIMLTLVRFEAVQALFDNGGFESGGLTSWTESTFYNPGLLCTTGGSCINRSAGGTDKTYVVGTAGGGAMSQTDAHSAVRFPRFGDYSAVVNYEGSSNNANSLKQTTTVTSDDVDVDGKVHVRFAYAPVLENPGHGATEQPFFYIGVKNITKGGAMLYDKFAFSGQAGVPWQGSYVLYTDWQIVDIAPGAGQLDVGDTIELEVIAAGCSAGGHYGYVYVDAFGAFIPGLSISATGPASVSRTQNITYEYTWANTGNVAIDNVVLTSVAPANTTYVSNDAGCTNSSGTVTCNLGTKAPGANGTVHITFNVGMGASGSINHGNYSIAGTGFAQIIGPLVTTTVNPDFPPSGFTSGTPASGTYGAPYSHDFDADGVPAPTYSVYTGAVPPGLTLNAVLGVLSGTPTAAGTYNFTIRASNLVGYADQAYSITINKANTSASASRSVTSPVYGQPVYLTATVSAVAPAAFTPAGQVQFYVDGAPFGAPVSLSSGTASSQTWTTLSAGDHTYSAVYLGDANNNASSTASSGVHINQNSTTTGVVSSAATSVYGQPLRLTATVDEVLPSVVNPAGQVQFYVDGSALGSPVALDASSQAVTADLHTLLPGGHLLVGAHTFSAAYLGNSNTLSSAAGTMSQTVNPAPTTVTITSSENPTVYGTSLQMTISVTANAPSIAIPAGQVRLSIDGVPFGTSMTLNGSGQATRTVPYLNLWPGNHAITAVYTPADPAQFVGSNNNAAPLQQVVNKANPVFTITPSVSSPMATQPVSYSVVVGPSMPTQGTPTGTVRFYVDGNPVGGQVTLDASGKASIPQAVEFSAGDHTVTVSYSGDDYFLSVPVSPALNQSAAKAGSTVSILSVDPTASVVGQPVTVSIQATPAAPATGVPSGTVTVSNGVDTCEVTLNASGAGSCQLEPTGPGSPDLTASYAGSANFQAAVSAPFAGPVVSKADSAVAILGFAPSSPVVGQPVTFTFAVTPVAPGWGSPTGLVTISDGNGHSCSAPVSAGSCQITFDGSGPTQMSAAYEGDANFNASSTSAAVAGPAVAKASTSLALASSATPSVYGQPLQFTATLSVTAPGAGAPTGFVQFTIDGVNFGDPVALSGGSAVSAPVADLAVAAHTIGAAYLGDANFAVASASAVNQVVNKADTTLVLSSNLNPSPYGLSVLITATLTGNAPSQAIPAGGTVQFIVDGVNYGAPVAVDASGKAYKLLPYTALWVGTHTITAVYSGDASFNGSNNFSSPFSQVVEKGLLVVTLTPTVESPVFGQPFGFSAGVAGDGANNPKPTGTVQFVVDGVNLGAPVTLDAAGSAASEMISTLAVGPHTLALVYSGDDYYKASTVTVPDGVVVGKASVSATISGFNPAAAVVGQPVTVSFGTVVLNPGAGTPTGTITISNGTDSCTAPVSAGSCDLVTTSAGSTQLSIAYSGDANFNPQAASTPQAGPEISPASVTVEITGTSAGPVVVGQPYTIYAQVSPVAPGTLIPAGMTITLGNGTNTCIATIQPDGSASCSITPTSAGAQNLSASFTGAPNYADATSAAFSGPVVGPASTTTSLVSSINPVVEGAAVRFTATVLTVAPGSGTPAGQVQFKIDGVDAGAPVALVNGVAAGPEVTSLTVGTHAVTAVYLGNANYSTSTSAAFSQKAVTGSLGGIITPSAGGTLTYHGTQDGLPVTTTIVIPAGAVSENVTLVFHQFYNSLLTPPAGKAFVASFTVDAYINGVLQPSLAFLKPVTFTMSYNPKNWKESDMGIYAWNGSQWNTNGLAVTGQDLDAHTITFTLNGTGAPEFSLACRHEYFNWLPIMGKLDVIEILP